MILGGGNMEREVKIVLVPKEWIAEDTDMFRVECEGLHSGWGRTLEEAIRDFDKENGLG